jgi:hypothetical protein
MSADIQKEAVFDDRIVQSRPRYAVEKGALSLTNAPFNAIASTASQMTFNVYVPSENVFVDRALRWSATGRFSLLATPAGGASAPVAGDPILVVGQDLAASSFPLNYLCQTMTATINDTTAVINSQDVLLEVLRLTDYKKNLLQRTCPTMLDKYQSNYLAAGSVNNPLSGYSDAVNDDIVPNGAFLGFNWTDPNGVPLVGTASPAYPGAPYDMVNGVPVFATGGVAAQTLYFSITSTEKLVLSPFVFADDCESDTGLFGINNIQLVMNFKSPGAGGSLRVLKTLGNQGTNTVVSNVVFNTGASGGVWANPVMNVQFLTPSLDVPLPPKSVVPYMEFPRYITQSQNGSINAYGSANGYTAQLQSQTITLPQIPDLLIIYVKATQVSGGAPGVADPLDPSYCDAYLPIASQFNSSIKNPLSINFDNFSGLLSSHTTEELYQMSVSNGLEMEWNQWSGLARSPAAIPVSTSAPVAGTYPGYASGAWRPTSGGFLVLKPSKDITLQSGQAPSLVGNFTLQFNLSVVNTFPFAVQPTLYVITANSGFFESIRGSSRIIKGVLSEQDIISAPVASAQTHEGLKRLVGGKISFGSLANVYNKAKSIYDQTKPVVSAIKNALPGEGMMGKAKSALGAVGYGTGSGKQRKGLSARLMMD